MKIVLDTNVLLSGLMSPFGPPGEILGLVTSGRIQLCYDTRILVEYRDVLLRPKFEFEFEDIDDLLHQVTSEGEAVSASPLSKPLPDPDDEPFLEVAIAAAADCLVTGNLKHFPVRRRQRMKVMSPREFLDDYRQD